MLSMGERIKLKGIEARLARVERMYTTGEATFRYPEDQWTIDLRYVLDLLAAQVLTQAVKEQG